MHRFFTDVTDGTARITGEDLVHLSRVLRLKAGDPVGLCDGRGTEYAARIETLSKDEALCRVESARPSDTEPACRVTLYQCLPKAGKLETVIQKCTELGVYEIIPVVSRYCVAEPDGFSKKLPRLSRVAYEAAKQSRRGRVPRVGAPIGIASLEPGAFDAMCIAYENERERTLKSVLRHMDAPARAALLIGPEGGFEESEVAALVARGALSVSLGPRILRTETAGPAMLAQLLYEVEP